MNLDPETRAWLVTTVTAYLLLAFVALSFIGTPPVVSLAPAVQFALGVAALTALGLQVQKSYAAVQIAGRVATLARARQRK